MGDVQTFNNQSFFPVYQVYMYLMQAQGFSLIEVLISLLLIALILFGLDAMQVYSLKQTKIAFLFNTANNQLMNMSERLLALQARDGLTQQITLWNKENQLLLPQGQGMVMGDFPYYTITLYWGNTPQDCRENKIGESGCLKEKIQTA